MARSTATSTATAHHHCENDDDGDGDGDPTAAVALTALALVSMVPTQRASNRATAATACSVMLTRDTGGAAGQSPSPFASSS